jgi:hypothetical protein
MKLKFSALILGIIMASMTTFATQIVITPPDPDMGDLVHANAYKWKLDLNKIVPLANSTWEVSSAKLEILGIRNTMEPEADILYASLLDLMGNSIVAEKNSVVTKTDDRSANYFGGTYSGDAARIEGYTSSSQIGTWSDDNINDGTRHNISWDINKDIFNSYKSDNGWIGIGIDPDCEYTIPQDLNYGVQLTLDYRLKVPEPTSIGMLLMGLMMFGGVALSRKKRS